MSTYWDYLPDLNRVSSIFITFTPLFSYGTTCLGIYKQRSSVGFSIDICATMLMSSILRILYYFISPYEIALFRQSLVMVAIQCVLLKVSLAYRPHDYDPDILEVMPHFKNELNANMPRRLSASYNIVNHDLYNPSSSSSSTVASPTVEVSTDYLEYTFAYITSVFNYALKFFDVHYRRPYCFWQWVEEAKYWQYVGFFTAIFSILTMIFSHSLRYATGIGILGLFIESLLPLPQILLLQRLRSIRNFKVVLLLSWLGGDVTKITYLVYGARNTSIIFVLAGLFQMGLDLIIAYQYLHYKKQDQQGLVELELSNV
ncbi:hypothetical protein PGUG_04805 [Meyerozyma guilliermondii ATCC 6260]|uniref:PQ-loop repeat-containing protein 1 n=1 Tax=Meyerozyma guilliermondii (strain ATCC 6260 / CBS 566 / DSM 6381 / JCM 1539 / NBRC 10279 / NRRL Y-324) TaxID=294746 RepID=A5DNF4_PICGU|nr:uncharacterized protein PGUG_04805 [Meyerozyma guilliermondii ATCC 6260]EDK40707.2 hypothetical protein PGUG_04805 [Meyerozyma guilliermondii ATCC 6260]